MTLTTETWISVMLALISIAGNVIQFLQNKRLKQEMAALRGACGNYLHNAANDKSQRSELHAHAEGVIVSLWEALGRLSE